MSNHQSYPSVCELLQVVADSGRTHPRRVRSGASDPRCRPRRDQRRWPCIPWRGDLVV